MSISDLIDNIGSGNNVEAQKSFDSVLGQKVQNAMDARKIEIASSIGKTTSEVEEE